jgi:hypothetical protein
MQSAKAYSLGLNGSARLDQHWGRVNGTLRAIISSSSQPTTLTVPVIPNGRDKLLYAVAFLEDGNTSLGFRRVTVQGGPNVAYDDFLLTFDNPFSRHWNVQGDLIYIAIRIGKDVIGDQRRLAVQLDTRGMTSPFRLVEMGTHDADVPIIT